MPESSSRVSETRPDHTVVVEREMDDYFQSSNEAKNSVGMSTGRYGDRSKIRENEKSGTSEMRSMSGEVDLDLMLAKRKRSNGELTREPWMERDTSCFIGNLTQSQEGYFVTGSSYEGSWDALGMAGVGRYVMPHGTAYEGEMRDGMFHGQGSLYWPENQRLDVVHLRGELKKHRYTFHDGLVYEEKNWNYCKFPDRRFYESVKKGLRPGGRTLKTGEQPTRVLPSGCYDTGDGVFDPKTLRITSFNDCKKPLRLPCKDEREWIVKKCRKSWTEPTGYRPDLNENWSDDPLELPYNLPMSQDSPDHWWKRLTTFARDRDFAGRQSEKDVSSKHDESSSPPEVCMCGQYVIIGEPCHCVPVSVSSEAEEYEKSERNFSVEELGKYYDDDESKQTFLASAEDSSVDDTLNCPKVKSFSREMYKKSSVTKKMDKGTEEPDDIDLNFSSSFGEDFLENSLPCESSKQSRDTRKQLKGVKLRQLEDESRRREQRKDESPKYPTDEKSLRKRAEEGERVNGEISEDFVHEEILHKADKDIQLSDNKSKDFTEDDSQEKSYDKNHENEASQGAMENKVVGKFAEESNSEKIKQSESVIRNQVPREPGEKSHEQKDRGSENTMEERILQKSDEESHQENVLLSEDIAEEISDKNAEESPKESSRTEEKLDYTSESIPGEKVAGVTEPETRNDRRLETKLLPKDVPERYHDHISIETESIEKKSQLDLPYDRGNANADIIVEYSMDEDGIKLDGEIISETLKTHEKLKENSRSKTDDEASRDLLGTILSGETGSERFINDDKSSTEGKIKMSGTYIIEQVQSETENQLAFIQSNKSSPESENKLKTGVDSRSKTTPQDNIIPSTIGKEVAQNPELVTAQQSSRASYFMKEGTSSSAVISERWGAAVESSVSLKDNRASLDQVHPSLATIVSTKPELPKEKEIIEIYSKYPSNGKPKTEPMNSSVWRLSGVNPEYGPKTKIENLFHSALTAPRSENVEYVRKPCDFRVCKPPIREVRTTASRTRKECPCNVPSKAVQSSARRNLNEK